MSSKPRLVVHGGAGAWAAELASAAGAGIRAALAAGWRALDEDGSALDGVEAAVTALENNEIFNAGRGSCLTSDGRVQMDTLIMDGETLEAGAVACVERVRNPIHLARAILAQGKHVLYAGHDAERLAEALGFELCDNEELVTDRQRRHWRELQAGGQDTVGAVAVDARGNVASATSTGGMHGKASGRVGDSPLVGCGGYADNQAGAVSATGWGEGIMRLTLSRWAADRMRDGVHPQRTAELAIDYLAWRLNGTAGLITLSAVGDYGAARNTTAMPWGMKSADEELVQEL